MTTFHVHVLQTVSTTVEVEADNWEQARDEAMNAPDAPGSITVGAFGGGCSVDEAGDWTPVVVYDADHNEIWNEEAEWAGQSKVSDDPATIERVAKALYEAHHNEFYPDAFEDLPDRLGSKAAAMVRDEWREQARAAVRALQGEA